MDITSVSYFLFVGISLLVYWVAPARLQWVILLADSLVFYFFNAVPYTYIYLLLSVGAVYFATWVFGQTSSTRLRKSALVGALVVLFGLLAILKYTNLAISTVNFVGNKTVPLVSWAAPLAVSFYTLQIAAYLLDCYWGGIEREKKFFKLLLFTSFFPLMVSGPISDYQILGCQLFEEHRFDYGRVVSGLRRSAWGVAKKVVVADRMIIPVDYMFDHPDQFSGIWIFVAAIGFAVVLYFDFSGCMDIIIGVAKCFGILLEENFQAPFLSRTIQEFWQRWHITLGRWLKSFIMYPILKTNAFVKLGSRCRKKFGKQGRKIPTYIVMLAVWFLMGLWHGSSWKYVVGEGLWFWMVIISGQIFEPVFLKLKKSLHVKGESRIWRGFQVSRTLILFSVGMLFFKADTLQSALYMLSRVAVPTGLFQPLRQLYYNVWAAFGGIIPFIAVVIIGLLQIVCDVKTYNGISAQDYIAKMPFIIRWGLYFVFVFLIVIAGNFGKSPFIYFGF